MTRRAKAGFKRKSRKMIRVKGKTSDESDEDYMVSEDEEIYESDGVDLEEIIGEFENEEEEGFVQKKVKKVGRSKINKNVRSRGRDKNGIVKTKKKRIEDEDEDEDEDDSDYTLDDEIINEVEKPRKKKRVSYREEEEDDDDFGYVKVNKVVQPRKKKRVSYREEEDDDYNGTDDDFDDVKVNKVVKSTERKRFSYIDEDDDFDDVEVNKVAKSRVKKSVSYREEEDENDDDVMGDKNVRSRNKKRDSSEEEDEDVKRRKKKRVSYREEDDEYEGLSEDDDDDDDDDDDEFRPDEINGVDDEDEEEDELPIITKNKKIGRRRLQGKRITTKGQKRKRNSRVVKRNVRKKPRKNRVTHNNGEFIDKKPIVEDKVNGRRKNRRITMPSDSDFVSSGSSEYEFTISEEEREQIREANLFCRFSTTTLSNKLEVPAQRKCLPRKGKEKVEDLKVEATEQVCGVCLTEEGKKTVRGTLDCCSHYFCFSCIMEWSKVESRCPLCKQRFVTISKPSRSNTGFDLRTVAIQIPERDQVYEPSEEELQGLLNQYDDVFCTECNQGGDDELMLLCDLCDSPAHTYCVGLGHEVPEGNWYCEGCKPTVLEVSTPTQEFRTNSNLSVTLSPVSSIRETFDLNEMYVPETPLTQETPQPQLPSPRPSQLPSPSSGAIASTLLGRRRIHQLINSRRRRIDENTPPIMRNPNIPLPSTQPSTSTDRSFHTFSLNTQQQIQPCSSRSTSINIEKEQVQSMVKHHLRSFSRNLELGYNTFKDIARSSTHTILAACGIEHRRNGVIPVQTRLICTHSERGENGNIEPDKGYCTSCFDLFVRGVVREIMNVRVTRLSKD